MTFLESCLSIPRPISHVEPEFLAQRARRLRRTRVPSTPTCHLPRQPLRNGMNRIPCDHKIESATKKHIGTAASRTKRQVPANPWPRPSLQQPRAPVRYPASMRTPNVRLLATLLKAPSSKAILRHSPCPNFNITTNSSFRPECRVPPTRMLDLLPIQTWLAIPPTSGAT